MKSAGRTKLVVQSTHHESDTTCGFRSKADGWDLSMREPKTLSEAEVLAISQAVLKNLQFRFGTGRVRALFHGNIEIGDALLRETYKAVRVKLEAEHE